MKIDQTLFSLFSSYVSLRGKVFRKLVITEMMRNDAFSCIRMGNTKKNLSMILKFFFEVPGKRISIWWVRITLPRGWKDFARLMTKSKT